MKDFSLPIFIVICIIYTTSLSSLLIDRKKLINAEKLLKTQATCICSEKINNQIDKMVITSHH